MSDNVLSEPSSTTCSESPVNLSENTDCSHYQRHIDLYSECCQKWWPCHVCHDEDPNSDHEMDRHDVKTIRCRECHLVQPLGTKCQNAECSLSLQFDLYCC